MSMGIGALRLAALSLTRRRLPTLIALLAIALPVAAGGMLLRLYQLSLARFATLDQSFDAVVGGKGDGVDLLLGALDGEGDAYPAPFTANLVDTLRDRHVADYPSTNPHRLLFLRSAVPLTLFARYGGHRVVGTDDAFWHRPRPEHSPELAAGRIPAATDEVALGAALAAQRGLAVGDRLLADPWVSAKAERNDALPRVPLRVVGIMRSTGLYWDQMLVADVGAARQVLRGLLASGELHPVWQEKIVHYLLVNCQPGGFAPLSDLINNATIAQAVSVPAAVARLKALTVGGASLGLFMIGMILALGALAVAGIMATRFDGMLGQLAVLRAIGYSFGEVARWLLAEGLLLGGAAVALGAGLDAACFPWLRDVSGVFVPAGELLAAPLAQSLPVWAAALAATVAAACLPLARLYRQDVHRALRSL